MRETELLYLQASGGADALARILNGSGIHAEGFGDPRSFLVRLKEALPGACLIDLTGRDLEIMLTLIKSIRNVLGDKLPLIALLAPGDSSSDAKARAAGATDTVDLTAEPDDLVLALAKHLPAPPAGQVKLPSAVRWSFERISPILAGLESSLQEQDEIEAQVSYFSEHLAPLREPFVTMVSAMRKSGVKADLTQSIRMYGMRQTRNLLVAARLSELTGAPLFAWNPKTGLPTTDPARIVHFANRALDHFGEDSRYRQVAYNAGLVLDLLHVLADSLAERKTVVRRVIQESFEAAIGRIDRCLAAGVSAKSLVLERHVVSTHLMRAAGSVAMTMSYPDYLELKLRMERKETPFALQHLIETDRYGVSSNLLGALICASVPGSAEAAEAVLFLDYPFLIRDLPGAKDAFDLIQVCQAD